MANEDHYAVLGVGRDATPDDIKRAYRRLTWENHPDRHPGDADAAERYRLINVAHATLSDPVKRAKYDASLRLPQLDLSRGIDAGIARDLLGNVFGDVFGTKRRQRRRGRDLKYTLTVSLEDAVLGSSHSIEFEAPGPCDTCSGTGTKVGGRAPEACPVCDGRGEVKPPGLFTPRARCGRCDGTGMVALDPCKVCAGRGTRRRKRSFRVTLPPGTEPGTDRVLSGQGEPGRFGGAPGDLRVRVNVRPHRWLERDGDNLVCEVPISISEAATGAKVPVPTVDGIVDMEVPRGVRSGARLRLRGKGVPGPRGRGDQLVTLVVETPVLATSGPDVQRVLDELERVAGADALPRRAEQRTALATEGEDGDDASGGGEKSRTSP